MVAKYKSTNKPKFVDFAQFSRRLRRVWSDHTKTFPMAVAVSGGPDSMALWHLCRLFRNRERRDLRLIALIVDHQARKDSVDEARKVRDTILQQRSPVPFGAELREEPPVEAKILKMDWAMQQRSPNNFESLARRMRFQLLARACIDVQTPVILMGHHEDDQTETVLSRIINGYTGSGLQATSPMADMAECHGLYGVKSGSPWSIRSALSPGNSAGMSIESGGLSVVRPLLRFSKADLISTCQRAGVSFVEDKTNADPTLTTRNTVRMLLRDECLPRALRKPRLLDIATRKRTNEHTTDTIVANILQRCSIHLNLAASSLKGRFPVGIQEVLARENSPREPARARRIAAKLVRRLVELVSPQQSVDLAGTELPVQLSFPFLFSASDLAQAADIDVAPVAKVLYEVSSGPKDRIHFQICRSVPSRRDKQDRIRVLCDGKNAGESLEHFQTQFTLFDGRFWIRLRHDDGRLPLGHSIIIRHLLPGDLASAKGSREKFDDLLDRYAPGNTRFTLPTIIERYPDSKQSEGTEMVEKLRALPSLGYGGSGWQEYDGTVKQTGWTWEIRYKKIEFSLSDLHTCEDWISREPNSM